jgi:hypothetical protein
VMLSRLAVTTSRAPVVTPAFRFAGWVWYTVPHALAR